jgi:signal transduction histidine kinase
MAGPMALGDECSGVVVLVNRKSSSDIEQRTRTLRTNNLEALGTGILLVRRNLELSARFDAYHQNVGEQTETNARAAASGAFAHEVRSKLNEIFLCLDNLRDPSRPDLHTESISSIQDSFDNLARMADEIVRQNDKTLVDVHAVVEKAKRQNSIKAGDRRVTVTNSVGQDVRVHGAPNDLTEVLSSVLENAIEACPSTNGMANINITKGPRGMVGITVQDNGHGVQAEDLPFVFIKGVSTKERQAGTIRGYGLNNAKVLMLSASGDIQIKSDGLTGEGTEVTIWLPGEVSDV